MREHARAGRVAGLDISITPSFFVGTLILWLVLSGVGMVVLELPALQAAGGGLVATLLYWVTDVVHHLGHAWAARRTGYPMVGVRLGSYLVFGTSLYPADEPALPAGIHIRRALGGPLASLLFAILAGIVALVLRPLGGVAFWLALFVLLTSFVVYTIGPFLPLGFTDGSTLLQWWGKE
jgi:hypothetical protein